MHHNAMTDHDPKDLLAQAEAAIRQMLSADADESNRTIESLAFEAFDANSVGDEQIELRIVLGRTRLREQAAQQLRSGSVVMLDKEADDFVDVWAWNRLVARGEAVVVDGKVGVRLMETFCG